MFLGSPTDGLCQLCFYYPMMWVFQLTISGCMRRSLREEPLLVMARRPNWADRVFITRTDNSPIMPATQLHTARFEVVAYRRGLLGQMRRTQTTTVRNKPPGHLGWDGRDSNKRHSGALSTRAGYERHRKWNQTPGVLPWVPVVPRSRQPTTVTVAARGWERGLAARPQLLAAESEEPLAPRVQACPWGN